MPIGHSRVFLHEGVRVVKAALESFNAYRAFEGISTHDLLLTMVNRSSVSMPIGHSRVFLPDVNRSCSDEYIRFQCLSGIRGYFYVAEAIETDPNGFGFNAYRAFEGISTVSIKQR
jgi:hypothetical protein